MKNLDSFTRSYIETALWSCMDYADGQGGEPLDLNYSVTDISPEAMETIKADCDSFRFQCSATIADFLENADDSQVAHDFWLTRNGHGAGFWDGDYREPIASELTAWAKSFGSVDLYVGDDGLIYCA